MRERDNRNSLATHLHYTPAVTRPLPGWSIGSEYENRASVLGTSRMRKIEIFSPYDVDGTTYLGDSGSGVLRRRGGLNGRGGELTNEVGDVLYGLAVGTISTTH